MVIPATCNVVLGVKHLQYYLLFQNSYSHGSQSGSQKDGHSRHGNEMWLSGRRIRLPWDLYPYKPYNESTRLIAKAETSNDQKELLNLYDMWA